MLKKNCTLHLFHQLCLVISVKPCIFYTMMTTTQQMNRKISLYESVATRMMELMDEGTFNPGERVPSIRTLSRQFKVSINTVKMAYGFLEDRRIIEARAQSGYYVCPRLPQIPSEPIIKAPRVSPAAVTASEVVMQVMGDVIRPDLVQFGAAIPAPHLIPAKKLNSMLSTESRRFQEESVGYAMPPGNIRLRTQIAKRMIKAGCTLVPDDIIITTGAAEAVFLALRTLCRPGDTLAIGMPLYFNFLQLIRSLGIKVLEIPMSPLTGIHLGALEQALQQHTVQACLVISNFNNPLGNCMPDERKEGLLMLLRRFNVPLIEDDINGDISHTSVRPSVVKSWDTRGDVLLCSSFSKTLAPGYRMGWIAPGKFYDRVKHQKLVTNIATASPPQLAIARFLSTGGYDHHLRSIGKVYAAKVVQMADAVGRFFPKGTRVTRPSGGFTLWVELPRGTDSLALYTLAREKGISIAPGHIFSTTADFSHCIRLNAAFWSEDTRWAVETLGDIARKLSADSGK